MPEWQVTFADRAVEHVKSDRLFITQTGVLVFTDVEGKRQMPSLAFAPGEWKKVVRVDTESLTTSIS